MTTNLTLAFDVYGTLIDTQDVTKTLEKWIGDQAQVFSETWRNKQLEYSFRRGLMQSYLPFSCCTSQALQYACQYHGVELSPEQIETLLASYLTLPAFADVEPALKALKENGVALFAFSNGEKSSVDGLLKHAGLDAYFDGVISCEEVQTFKPNPVVYDFLVQKTGAIANQLYLVSTNSFDITGAISSGLKAAWIKRSEGAMLDPWGIEPTHTVTSLQGLLKIK